MSWKDRAKANINRVEQQRTQEREQTLRQQSASSANFQKALELIQGEPTIGRDAFVDGLAEFEVKAGKIAYPQNEYGPWIGFEIGDLDAHIADIKLFAAVDFEGINWMWIVECGGHPKPPKKRDMVRSGPNGPSAKYVTETFGRHFNFCYEHVKR